jgi:hypothetical protein
MWSKGCRWYTSDCHTFTIDSQAFVLQWHQDWLISQQRINWCQVSVAGGDSLLHVGICSNFIASKLLFREITGPHTASRPCDWLWHYGKEVLDHPAYSHHLVTRDFSLLESLRCTGWQVICNRHPLATNTGHIYLLYLDLNLGVTVGQVLKCQWWLRWCMVGTICYTCAIFVSK